MSQQSAKEKAEAYVRQQLPELMELSRNCAYRRKSIKGRWFDHVLDYPCSFEMLCGCQQGKLTTQAFITYKCGLCRKGKSWHNGGSPQWCLDCAKERSVCPHCKAKLEIIGHPIQLQHWLRVLGGVETEFETVIYPRADTHIQYAFLPPLNDDLTERGVYKCITFNLTTGQPTTEEDYKAFCEIVGVGN